MALGIGYIPPQPKTPPGAPVPRTAILPGWVRAWLGNREKQDSRTAAFSKGHLVKNQLGAMQLNQNTEAAAQNRARLDVDRRRLVEREERRVWRYQQKLESCTRPKATAKARRRLGRAQSVLAYVRINGSRPPKKRKR